MLSIQGDIGRRKQRVYFSAVGLLAFKVLKLRIYVIISSVNAVVDHAIYLSKLKTEVTI